jgi:hypothetical protein
MHVVSRPTIKQSSATYSGTSHMDENFPPQPTRQCSQSKCKHILDAGYQFKSCEQCREHDKLAKQKKRQRDKENKESLKRPWLEANYDSPEVIEIDSGTSDDEHDSKVSNSPP